jgi:hypothetical protein
MTATTATDDSEPVEYYFECTTDGDANSTWQTDTTYTAYGLMPSTQYTFRVKARDSSPAQNETNWSSPASATTDEAPTLVEILGDWVTGTSHAEEAGYSRALIFIAHAEHSSTVTLNSVTYGGQSMTKIIDESVGTGYSANVTAFILDEAGIDAATSSTFSPSWSATPENTGYISVFLGSVNQTTSVGDSDDNSTTSSITLTTDPLTTAEGDMVFVAATCGNQGNYTVNNDFNEAYEHDMASSTGTDGYKAATGVSETPSVTHNDVNRQVIIGFVIQAIEEPDNPPAAPNNLAATAGNYLVSLDWDDNSETDLAGYNVYRSENSGSNYGKINVSLVADSNYVDNDANNWTDYYYVVTAVDANSHESVYSNEATATPDYQNCDDVQDGNDGFVSDITNDCYVDSDDIAVIANYWLHTDCAGLGNCDNADLEQDGDVDFIDFTDFAIDWLRCNNPEDEDCTPNWL